MTATCIPYTQRRPTNIESNAISGDACFVFSIVDLARTHLSNNTTRDSYFHQAVESFGKIIEECSEGNWDGCGADPVNPNSFLIAYQVFQTLPTWFSPPEISCDPDGEVSFGWYFGPNKTFSISIGSNGELHFSGLFGFAEAYGTEHFYGELPNTILDNICRVHS